MTPMLIPSSPPDQLGQALPLQRQPELSHDHGAERNANLLLDFLSRARNTLEQSHDGIMQYARNLHHDLKPHELLVLQHRMAVHSAQLQIIKHTGEEIGRGINSIVNR